VSADGRGLVLPVYSFTGALVGVKVISAREETDSAKTHVTTRTIPRFSTFATVSCIYIFIWCLTVFAGSLRYVML